MNTLNHRRTRLALPAAALLWCLLPACSDVAASAQDITIRHDAEADALTLHIDTRGLGASGGSFLDVLASLRGPEEGETQGRTPLERASRMLTAAGDGARIIHLAMFGLDLNLDQPSDGSPAAEQDPTAAEARVLAALASVTVDGAGLYRDGNGAPGLWQRLRVTDASKAVAAINEGINGFLLSDELDQDASPRERAAHGARVRYAEENRPWVILGEEALEIRIPAQPHEVAEALRELPSAPGLGSLLEGLDEVSMADGVVRLRFPFDPEGRLHVHFQGAPRDKASAELARALGPEALPVLTPAEVRSKLHPQPAGK